MKKTVITFLCAATAVATMAGCTTNLNGGNEPSKAPANNESRIEVPTEDPASVSSEVQLVRNPRATLRSARASPDILMTSSLDGLPFTMSSPRASRRRTLRLTTSTVTRSISSLSLRTIQILRRRQHLKCTPSTVKQAKVRTLPVRQSI